MLAEASFACADDCLGAIRQLELVEDARDVVAHRLGAQCEALGNFSVLESVCDQLQNLAVSNIPFGDFPVVDAAFLKPSHRFLTRSIHNYFFVKALTKVRPGGVLAFITSRYTLDAPSAEPVRRHLHERADRVAAVRLPSGIFPDTDVVADLVIMRKRLPNESVGDDAWVRTVPRTFMYQRPPRPNPSGQTAPEEIRCDINAYFIAHPELVLGVQHATSAMHGAATHTVKLPLAGSGAVISGLREIVRSLPSNVVAPRQIGPR